MEEREERKEREDEGLIRQLISKEDREGEDRSR